MSTSAVFGVRTWFSVSRDDAWIAQTAEVNAEFPENTFFLTLNLALDFVFWGFICEYILP
jgi:hypothetical protein